MAKRIREWSTEDLERRASELRVEALRKEHRLEDADEENGIASAMEKELMIRRGSIRNPTRDTFRRIGWTEKDVERYVRLHGEPEYSERPSRPPLPKRPAAFREAVSGREVSGEAQGPFEDGEYYFVASDDNEPTGRFAPVGRLRFSR
jgi:hypothetical protein